MPELPIDLSQDTIFQTQAAKDAAIKESMTNLLGLQLRLHDSQRGQMLWGKLSTEADPKMLQDQIGRVASDLNKFKTAKIFSPGGQ